MRNEKHTASISSLAGPRVSRRAVLRAGAAAVAGAAIGPFVYTPARAQGFNWKRFQGKELYLLLSKHPWMEVLEKNIPEFEALSGMKMKWETLPEIQARQKLMVEMTGRFGKRRRVLHLAPRREEAVLEGGLVPAAEPVPPGPHADEPADCDSTTSPAAPSRSSPRGTGVSPPCRPSSTP